MTRRRYAIETIRFNQAAAAAAASLDVRVDRVTSCRRARSNVDAMARGVALYLVVTHFGVSRRRVARTRGMNMSSVCRWCQRIEEAREDPAIDRLIAGIEARLDAL